MASRKAPSEAEILAHVAAHPDHGSVEDVAAAMGLRGQAKTALRRTWRTLVSAGALAGSTDDRKLPSVVYSEVSGIDDNGDLTLVALQFTDVPATIILAAAEPAAATLKPGDRLLARVRRDPEGRDDQFSARLIRKLSVPQETARLGVIRISQTAARLEPVSRKAGKAVDLTPDQAQRHQDGELVRFRDVVTSRYAVPRVKIIEQVGTMDGPRAVGDLALAEHDIPTEFPSQVLAEAGAVSMPGTQPRTDWRELPFVTIDPADARDHDDAVYAQPDENDDNPDGWIIYVAIADVAAAIAHGSAMDREARQRGNSVYLADQVVPMLPERISNDLCSLRPHEDRAALAVRMVFDRHGQKRRHRFHRVLITSHGKLSYQLAQACADGNKEPPDPDLADPIRDLWAAYACLERGREARQPLDLDVTERKIVVDQTGQVTAITPVERLTAHRLIEEMMIQANVAAAESLDGMPPPLYRIHDSPGLDKLEGLRTTLATLDISLPNRRNLQPAQLNQILARAATGNQTEMINDLILRSQSQAEYSPNNIGHFGLNLPRYVHFTSPIRRYADLTVHRMLVDRLTLGSDGYKPTAAEDFIDLGAHLSAMERRAVAAERATNDRYIAAWLANRIGESFAGIISGVTKVGLFVRLRDAGADGFIPAASLGSEYFRFDVKTNRLVGDRTGRWHGVGDVVDVQLMETTPVQGAIRFDLLSDANPPDKRHRSRKPRPTKRGKAGRGTPKTKRGRRK